MSDEPETVTEYALRYGREQGPLRMSPQDNEVNALDTAELLRGMGWKAEVVKRTITTTPWVVVKPVME